MKLGRWSTTAGNNNSTPPDGWPEGQAPSTVNDCAREMMAAVRTAFNDLQYFDQDFTPTYISATTFSVTGDQTSAIHAGRRLKIYDATAGVATTIYATVVTASFTALTTIQVSADGGQLTSSLSSFALAILSRNNDSLPRGVPISASAIGTENLTVNGTTTASGAVTLLTTLSVSGATALKGDLSVGGNTTIAGTFTASGATTLLTTLSVSGATVLKAALSVGGAATFGTTLTASGAVVMNTTLTVSGAAAFLTTLSIGGATTLGTTLTVSGATVLKGALSIGGAVNLASTLTVGGAVAAVGAVRIDSTLSVSGTVVAANIAKAWVRITTGNPPTVVTSFNVASVSRSAAGVFRINFSTALGDGSFAFAITADDTSFVRALSAAATGASLKVATMNISGVTAEGMTITGVFYR